MEIDRCSPESSETLREQGPARDPGVVARAVAVPPDEALLAEGRAGKGGYRRLLGPFDATMIVAGSMIGSGIFVVPAEIARDVGTAGWLVAVWILTGLMTVVAARAFAELSIAYPRAGGQYVFLREAFGPLAGFLYGWTLALVIQTGTIAAVAVAFAAYLAELVPALGDSVLVNVVGAAITARQVVAVGLIALLTVANTCGLNVGKRIQNGFTVTKLAALAAIVLIGLGLRPNSVVVAGNLVAPFSAAFSEGWIVAALGAAMVGALFSADAWSNVTFTAAEVRDPSRTLPRALVAGTTIVVVLYLLVNLAYLAILPVRGVEGAEGWLAGGIAGAPGGRVATAAMGAAFGADAAVVMALLVMVSTFGCANGLILAGPRLIQAMAADGLFFRGLAQLAANGVPRRALVAQGLWASLLALSGRYGQLLDYVIATALVFYALTMLGLLRLRRRPEFVAATEGVRAGTLLPVVYVVLALAITVDLLIVKPNSTWPGFAIVACGLPAALFWRRGVRAGRSRAMVLAVSLALLGAQSPRPALAIPATSVMTLYRFNGALDIPFYAVADVVARGSRARPVGSLAQGTSVLPCLVVRDGRPLVDAGGVPWVGFEIVVDSRRATRASTATFRAAVAARRGREVRNHHCTAGVDSVLDVRNLYPMEKAPWFDPPPGPPSPAVSPGSDLDAIVRAFHGSPQCTAVQDHLLGRRVALARAWDRFAAKQAGRWPGARLERARQLDYAMRTALFEAHLGRGCSAYAACERNAIALSLRNRAGSACSRRQGCRYPGDITGVAAEPSQYNIWDEVLMQISGLGSCFLRPDLARDQAARRLQAMYAQSRPDVESILFGNDRTLAGAFAAVTGGSPRTLRHYYHPPAMGKCFPGHPRIEYMTGAVARRGRDFALLANRRVEVGARHQGGFGFRTVSIDEQAERDVIGTSDDFPGFVLDARQVKLQPARGCRPFGTPAGCGFANVGRHRRVPSWLASGQPLALTCRARARGESCAEPPRITTVTVGGPCDALFQPVAGVP